MGALIEFVWLVSTLIVSNYVGQSDQVPDVPEYDWIAVSYPPDLEMEIKLKDTDEDITNYKVVTKEMSIWSSGTVNKYYEFSADDSLLISDLTPKSHYKVQVQAEDSAGWGDWTGNVQIWAQSNVSEPDPVLVTSPSRVESTDSYTLTWELTLEGQGVMPIVGYRIILTKITEPYPWHDEPIFERDIFMDRTSYTFTNLDPCSNYEVQIQAMNVLKYKTKYYNFIPQEGLRTVFKFRVACY